MTAMAAPVLMPSRAAYVPRPSYPGSKSTWARNLHVRFTESGFAGDGNSFVGGAGGETGSPTTGLWSLAKNSVGVAVHLWLLWVVLMCDLDLSSARDGW